MSEEKRVEWTDDRVAEFQELETLLHKVAGLNHGSNFLSHVEECIQIAERLTRIDIGNCRHSFLAYLRSDIIADRTNRLNAEGEMR